MDKADTDDSTPPPAVTKAPAPVRSIGGYYVRPAVPAAYAGREPPGFYADRDPPGFPDFVFLRDILDRFSSYVFIYNIPVKRWPDSADHQAIDRVIENHLATGAGRAAGIHPSTGAAVWAPCETWRLPRIFQGRQEYATWRALKGQRIRFPLPSRSFECKPFLSCRTMALTFGAKAPPAEPPQSVLDDIREVEGWDWKAPRTEAAPAVSDARPATHTGVAGRPTSIQLIEREFCRRKEAGETAGSLAEEARMLNAWLEATHPSHPPATPKTIENQIKRDFRQPPK